MKPGLKLSPLAGDSTQLSYTQKRTVKHILIRCGIHVTLPIFTQLDYAHMCVFVCATATYRLLLGVYVVFVKT